MVLSDKIIKGNFDLLILPGVGSFVEGMKTIKSTNFDNYIYDYVGNNKKLLEYVWVCNYFFLKALNLKKQKDLI